MAEDIFDAAIVGGGLAGRAAAIAVAQAGLRTLHLAPAGPPDRRTSALMQPTVSFLRVLGVVGDPAALGHPLKRIRIIDATSRLLRAPETLFDSAEMGLDAFGWNFGNLALATAMETVAAGLSGLETRAETVSRVTVEPEAAELVLGSGQRVKARLLVGADGRNSLVRAAAGISTRTHAVSEAALVCDLEVERPLEGESVEFHYPRGPFTLVPAGDKRVNLVWIDDRAVLDAARAAEPEQLHRQLAAKAQQLFGAIRQAGPIAVFPLSTLAVATAGRGRAVLVGEAAHAFPPIGAQGLNLGLRDVADLASALREGWRGDDAAQRVSAAYAAKRAGDLARTGAAVDALFRSLVTEMLPAQAARAGGLWALKLSPALRRRAFSLGMGVR